MLRQLQNENNQGLNDHRDCLVFGVKVKSSFPILSVTKGN